MGLKSMAIALGSLVAVGTLGSAPAAAQDAQMLGEIRTFGFDFCPRGWARTNGQLLAISQNQALFSLLGIAYGGDGRTTFALPDLRGRVIVSSGTGPGLTSQRLGMRSGSETSEGLGVPVEPSESGTRVQLANPENNMQPYAVVTTCIAMQGIFPSRN